MRRAAHEWYDWFAWYPVKIDGRWTMGWVQRRDGYYSGWDELRPLPKTEEVAQSNKHCQQSRQTE